MSETIVNIHAAKTRLSQLVARVEKGERRARTGAGAIFVLVSEGDLADRADAGDAGGPVHFVPDAAQIEASSWRYCTTAMRRSPRPIFPGRSE